MKGTIITALILTPIIYSQYVIAQIKSSPSQIQIYACIGEKQPKSGNCNHMNIETPEELTAGGGRIIVIGGRITCGPDGLCPKVIELLAKQNIFKIEVIKNHLCLTISNKESKEKLQLELGITAKGHFKLIEKTKEDQKIIFKRFLEKQSPELTKKATMALLKDVQFIIYPSK